MQIDALEASLAEAIVNFDAKRAEYEVVADLSSLYDERADFLRETHALRVRLMRLKNYDWDPEDLEAQEASLSSRLLRDLEDNRRKKDEATASERLLDPADLARLAEIRSAKRAARAAWQRRRDELIEPEAAAKSRIPSAEEEAAFVRKLGARYEALRQLAGEIVELMVEENKLIRPLEDEELPGGFQQRLLALYSDKLKEVSALSFWEKHLQSSTNDVQERIAAVRREMRETRASVCSLCGDEPVEARKCERCDHAFFCSTRCQGAAQRIHASECSSEVWVYLCCVQYVCYQACVCSSFCVFSSVILKDRVMVAH